MPINLSYVPLLTLCAPVAIAIISYYNYSLNKSLNIKNHLHAEKLKKYGELLKLISEMIVLLNQVSIIDQKKITNPDSFSELPNLADKIDEKIQEIDARIIESYLVIPDKMVSTLRNFSEFLHQPTPTIKSQDDFIEQVKQMDTKVREESEKVIEAFRLDLGTRRLNQKLLFR